MFAENIFQKSNINLMQNSMKPKSLLVLASLCLCTAIMAQTLPQKDNSCSRLRPVETPALVKDKMYSSTSFMEKRLKENEEKKLNNENLSSEAFLMNIPLKDETTKYTLDSIIGTNPDGSNYTRQIFIYNDQNLCTKRINSLWNADTQQWDKVEEYNFEWDEDGYILMQSMEGYGSGERHEYKYNEDKLGIEHKISIIDAESGKWLYISKGEYTYDNKGNIIEEMVYAWQNDKWTISNHNKATWDEHNRQTSIESMYWNGTEWTGETKQDYEYFSDNQLSYKGMYRWMADTKEWKLVQKFIQEFNDRGQCTAQRMRYWNEDRQDWSGEYPSWGAESGVLITYDAEISYDDKGRLLLQQHKDLHGGDEWFVSSEMITEWTDELENGGYQSEMNAYLYDYDTKKKTWNQQEFMQYDRNDSLVWMLNRMQTPDGSEMKDNYEEKYRYDDRKNMIYSAVWDWKDDVRTPTIEENITYDSDNNVIEAYYRSAEASGSGTIIGKAPQKRGPGHEDIDDEGWEYTSKHIYSYENGIRTSRKSYMWRDSDWTTNTGEEVVYDWDVPASELITLHGYTDPFKIDYIYKYTGNGADDWMTATDKYFYSEKSGIIQTQSTENNIYFSDNTLRILSDGETSNYIYDMTGRIVYHGNSKAEHLSHLPKGLYVAKCLTDGRMHTIKIAIE